MRINSKVTAVLASGMLLAGGGGVAYAADSCPGMGGTSTGTTTTTTTSAATTSTATASSDIARKHQTRRHATRHAGRL